MTPAVCFTPIRYRSLAGDWWPAKKIGARPRADGLADIEIVGADLTLTRLPIHRGDAATCPRGACMENPNGQESEAR